MKNNFEITKKLGKFHIAKHEDGSHFMIGIIFGSSGNYKKKDKFGFLSCDETGEYVDDREWKKIICPYENKEEFEMIEEKIKRYDDEFRK